MRPEQATHAFISAFVGELARSGVRHVCASPGSRSTPLTLLISRHPNLKLWMHLDERSAAFFALGLAKQTRRPVALVCSSGTAAANFLPAIVEARYARVPLVVLTADRPPELRDVGAPQAIDQLHLYGQNVKWFAEVGLPEGTDHALRYARTLACRAAGTALAVPAGPVHLNFPFREPLVPIPPDDPAPPEITREYVTPHAQPRFAESSEYVTPRPLPRFAAPAAYGTPSASSPLPDPMVDALAAELSNTERGLILCGPQDDPALVPVITALAHALHYPILADPLSQLRCGPHDRSLLLDSYDAVLRDPPLAAAPSVVLRFGAIPTSKQTLLYLQQHPCRQIVIDPGSGWNDPTLQATAMIHADPTRFCQALLAALPGSLPSTDWQDLWLHANQTAHQTISRRLAGLDELFEGKVFAVLAELLPDGTTLYAGNSMPVRDLDSFYPSAGRSIRFLANRGANGIDGVVSSALGAAVEGRPLVLVIGDLSFYHDMNGLLAAKLHELDATIILLNNDGGGIFSFLPQAGQVDEFEQLFGTPHGIDFRPAVEMYGGRFDRISTWDEFQDAVIRSLGSRGLSVIEVPTERARNVALHRDLWTDVSRALHRDVSEVGV